MPAKSVHAYTVIPALPPELAPLRELAYNLHWTWDHLLIDAFRRLDRDLWEQSGHNPAAMLGAVPQQRLAELAADPAYLAYLERCYTHHDEYLKSPSWFQRAHGDSKDVRIAYFSAEFGLTECVRVYSGGLGVLSGDHMKSSSELGIPLVGIGLLYQQGYFRQYLNADGWQQEQYPKNDFASMPIYPVRQPDGSQLVVKVPFPGREVIVQIWKIQVGRVPLYLLDTNTPDNSKSDQDITDQLYGGGRETRLCQEMILGMGGMLALDALGIKPTVCHMNEGHSAFQALERIRLTMKQGDLGFHQARELCKAGNVFTTHTPVPAGFDVFSRQLMEKYFADYVRDVGIDMETLLRMGRTSPYDADEPFNMAMLAVRNSSAINGVSELHGEISRQLMNPSVPGVPVHEVAVGHVTNGVHTRSWISREMTGLLTRYLGEGWIAEPEDQSVWMRAEQIPNEELWHTHERRRQRLVALARKRLKAQLLRRGASEASAGMAEEVLDSTALTIGFARRFATYKRATLLLRDLDRLGRILNDPDRPVQILMAGKAHPQDDAGKEFIRQIVHVARRDDFRRRVVFLEQYDISLARYLVQGVDLWLNTPQRPNEASGTSGMKVIFNGGLNLSILDGWWCEGYRPDVGWAIGQGEEYSDREYQDRVESDALYDLLEKDIAPCFYERGRDRLPRQWIGRMKKSMMHLGPVFNTNRMVHEYTERFYLPASERYGQLGEGDAERARSVAAYRARIKKHFVNIEVLEVVAGVEGEGVPVGENISVKATVRLGELTPKDVAVQLYDGPLDADRKIPCGNPLPMECLRTLGDGMYQYEGQIPCQLSGNRGFTVRVLPSHPDLQNPQMLGHIVWE